MWKLDQGTVKLFIWIVFLCMCAFSAAGVVVVVTGKQDVGWLVAFAMAAVGVATAIFKAVIECLKLVQDMVPDCTTCPAMIYAKEHGYVMPGQNEKIAAGELS